MLFAFAISSGFILGAQPLAFPGAEGFGKFATGGRGGGVYHVTNLNDSGAGSFRQGATTANQTIVFDVGGVIKINSVIAVANNVTIAGQTAPGGGATIYGHRLSYSGANNSVTRFLRARMGNHANGINAPATGDGNDTITIANGHDMIFDHCSVSWGQDETFSISGSDPSNISIQSTIISQGLQTHSAGGLIQTDGGVSILRCLYIDNHTRNPKVKGVNEYVNNIIYNWESDAYILGDSAGLSYANVIGNYFINGPGSSAPAFDRGNLNFNLYATNNWQDANLNGILDGSVLTTNQYDVVNWTNAPFAYPVTTALPPLTAVKLAVSDAGASWQRDAVDEQMMTELTSWGTLGETIYNEYQSPMNGPGYVRGGTSYPDSDGDGMPDFWESALGMATNAANNNDPSPSGSGYTRLEDYLNWLAEPHGIALTNTPICVDLRQFTLGFVNTSPVYSVTNITNGSVTYISGHTARFTPTTGFIGPAGFQFTVTDADGSTLTRQMNLFFTPAAQSFTPIWRGDDLTNNWSNGGDFNWFDGQSLLFPFHNGDSVLFDGTGSTSPFVNLLGSVQPMLVTFDATNDYTFGGSGSLVGSMTLNKTGNGTLTLNNTNTFSGTTTVSNGTLLVNGTLLNSAVTVKNGGTLGGSGRVSLTPSLESGARLAPGGVGSPGTLTCSNNLMLPGAVTLYFDLSDDPSGTVKTNDLMVVNGALTATGTNYIRVTLPDGPLNNGVYPLIKYGTFSGNLSNFVLINANGVLTNSSGQIAILVDNIRYPTALKWVGDGVNNNWDNGTTSNWLNGAVSDAFHFFDAPIFDDSGSTNPAVNLIGTLTPQSTTFDATENYTLAGPGKISGYGPLIKTNSGTLTILTTNDYAGQTVIGGGVLSVPWLPNADVPGPVGVVEADVDNLYFAGGTLRYTGGGDVTDRKLTFGNQGGTIDVSGSAATLTFNGEIAGGGLLTKIGPGTLALAGSDTHGGGVLVTAGTLQPHSAKATVTLGSGILTLDGTTNFATFQFGNDSQTLNNTLNVTGTNNFINLSGNDTVMDMTGDGTFLLNGGTTFTFSGDMSTFSGIIRLGTTTNPRFNGSIGSSLAWFDLGNGSAKLNNRNGGLTAYVGALSGGPNTLLQGASSASNPTTYIIGGRNMDTTFAGRITEVIPARSVAITKVGTGTFILTGNNTHNGATTINGGTLLVNNTTGSGTGTNSVTVDDGGTLGGTGFIHGSVVVNGGGAISPGSNGVGQLTLQSSLTLNAGAAVNFDVGSSSDKLVVSQALVLNGTFNVSAASGFGLGTYTVMTYGGALSGTMPMVIDRPPGYSILVNTNTAGQVKLVVQTQTQPVIGSLKLSGTDLVLSGSGGPTNDFYYAQVTTNLASPDWITVATNYFDAAGGFNLTNAVPPGAPQQFFRLGLP